MLKYINTKTGELCINLKEILHSVSVDFRYFGLKSFAWIFSWTLFKP